MPTTNVAGCHRLPSSRPRGNATKIGKFMPVSNLGEADFAFELIEALLAAGTLAALSTWRES